MVVGVAVKFSAPVTNVQVFLGRGVLPAVCNLAKGTLEVSGDLGVRFPTPERLKVDL